MEETFSPEDRKLAQGELPAESSRARSPIERFAAVLCIAVTGAAIVAGYAIWQLG